MTISLHTQTSAPNTSAATSVSPLEQSGSSKTKFSKIKTDIYQIVTDHIISALEAGFKPWSCPWQRAPGMSGLPTNYTTGAAYSGMNIMLLWCSASEQVFSDSRWMTYKQAKAEGGNVRKGEHGTMRPCMDPRMLAALGDNRDRFNSTEEIQNYAGIAPVTERSCQKSRVHWRWQFAKFVRQTFVEWAAKTVNSSYWARLYYQSHREKGKSH